MFHVGVTLAADIGVERLLPLPGPCVMRLPLCIGHARSTLLHTPQVSVVLFNVLRHQSVEEHLCRAHPENEFCGLGPSHPANIGKMLYDFPDPELIIKGSSTQTLTGGICHDKECNRLTTVTLHNGSCSYTADIMEGDKTDAEPSPPIRATSPCCGRPAQRTCAAGQGGGRGGGFPRRAPHRLRRPGKQAP